MHLQITGDQEHLGALCLLASNFAHFVTGRFRSKLILRAAEAEPQTAQDRLIPPLVHPILAARGDDNMNFDAQAMRSIRAQYCIW